MLQDEDIGKTLKVDTEKITYPKVSLYDSLAESVKIEGRYGKIYIHFDGYPDGGVGKRLLDSYNTYESALNLVLGGSCSGICKAYDPYAARRVEEWTRIKPKFQDTEPDLDTTTWIDYMYIYVENTGWWFRSLDSKEWINLEIYLKDKEEKED